MSKPPVRMSYTRRVPFYANGKWVDRDERPVVVTVMATVGVWSMVRCYPRAVPIVVESKRLSPLRPIPSSP